MAGNATIGSLRINLRGCTPAAHDREDPGADARHVTDYRLQKPVERDQPQHLRNPADGAQRTCEALFERATAPFSLQPASAVAPGL